MKALTSIAAAVGAVTLMGAAVHAHAQTVSAAPLRAKSRVEQTTPALAPDAAAWTMIGRRSLQWNSDGRWGLKLDFDQPASRDVQWKDVEAGASFRLTPQLRLGASVGLGEQVQPRRVTPDDKPQPRVRFETTFRF